MTKDEAAGGATDPFELWRQLYETNERAWSSALEEAMSGSGYDEASGRMLETMLAAQKSIRTNMRTYLETMNVPTREDIARLGELVVGLEEKIDQLADRFDGIEEAVRTPGPTGPAGATGRTGAAGRTGAKGPAGPKGRAGSPGKAGAKGATGARGPAATTKAVMPAAAAKPATRAKPAKAVTSGQAGR